MKTIELTINGAKYPCTPTGYAILEFNRLTGRDVSEIRDGNVADSLTYIYCCVKGACLREGIRFNESLDEFAAGATLDDITRWSNALTAALTGGEDSESDDYEGKKKV